ncbi:TetR/AcrR family transcriptional regulator [Saccharopolyspora rosea]|uniref:TetR/AcrR family transcriptional regulator n=1 Tax=Saccharopolyspora rosea TaxID=524884 RepID=UPI0021D7F1A9|nr:TetR/AcrR family transcriptional regulator [Saccharopolyspora rosea]
MASMRVYGGVTGEDRRSERRAQLVEAGLDLLGAPDPVLTVRGVCARAGLVTRYFYESFSDRDALAVAVFDRVVAEIADAALAAVEQVEGAREKARAGLTAIVRAVAEDPRRGRLLFSPALNSAVLADRRVAATRMFVRLLRAQARELYGVGENGEADLLADFLVGGLAQTLASWLAGTLDVTESELVDRCAEIFLAAGELV